MIRIPPSEKHDNGKRRCTPDDFQGRCAERSRTPAVSGEQYVAHGNHAEICKAQQQTAAKGTKESFRDD